MTFSRFMLASVAGACALWIVIFLGASFAPGYDSTGVIFWDGVIGGQFAPQYFAGLYIPPILLVACSYFALRRPKG